MNLKTPWTIASLVGKYYGTKIVNSEGRQVITVWLPGLPSEREDGEQYDAHYESEESLFVSQLLVNTINREVDE